MFYEHLRMGKSCILEVSVALMLALAGCARAPETRSEKPMFEEDTLTTSAGPLKITFVGHGTLMFTCGTTVVHVDPWSQKANYAKMPKADVVLVTHGHGDHLDPEAIAAVRKEGTTVLLPAKCAAAVTGSVVMKNGDARTIKGMKVEAVPAHNLVHERAAGVPYHPRGEGNGYVITFGDTRVYVAGDTENTADMKSLKDIDVAFLPMNLPYTMTPEMVADAAKAFRPKILYPYHTGKTDTSALVKLLAAEKSIEVRIRGMD